MPVHSMLYCCCGQLCFEASGPTAVGPAMGVLHTQGPLLKLATGVARARRVSLASSLIYDPGQQRPHLFHCTGVQLLNMLHSSLVLYNMTVRRVLSTAGPTTLHSLDKRRLQRSTVHHTYVRAGVLHVVYA
jgi:hypothetical protein